MSKIIAISVNEIKTTGAEIVKIKCLLEEMS